MNRCELAMAWCGELWELLARIPGMKTVEALQERWREYEKADLPLVVVFGAVGAGKSSLLKRILVENGVEVPDWLGVSGQRQTFRRDEIKIGEFRLVDTPGISGGDDEHDRIALEELGLADAYLWVMPPQLMTGDRELVGSFLSGRFFAKDLPSRGVTQSVIAVISRMDEAGTDPSYDLSGYKGRCEAKRTELGNALSTNGVEGALRAIHTVAADPYQMVADLPEPLKESYADARSWDGMNQLLTELSALVGDRKALRCMADVRFAAIAGQTVLDVFGGELLERERALKTCVNEIRRVEVFSDRAATLIDDARGALDSLLEEELVLAGRRMFQGGSHEIHEIVESLKKTMQAWAEEFAGKSQSLADELDIELNSRWEGPGMHQFRDLIEEAEGPRGAGLDSIRKGVSILERIAPAIIQGFREYAEKEIGMTLKQAASRLLELDAATRAFKTTEQARKAAEFVKADQLIGVASVVSEQLGGLWSEWAAERSDLERADRLTGIKRKLEKSADEVRNDEIARFGGLVFEQIREPLRQRKEALVDSEKVLSAQIEEFTVAMEGLRAHMSRLGDAVPA
jgi:hypothetical protein